MLTPSLCLCLADVNRDQCTSSPPSNSPLKLLKLPRKRIAPQMNSTHFACLMQRESVLSLVLDSGRRMARYISEQRSWRRARSGLGESRNFIRISWMSSDRFGDVYRDMGLRLSGYLPSEQIFQSTMRLVSHPNFYTIRRTIRTHPGCDS